jgi:hypothetical protein
MAKRARKGVDRSAKPASGTKSRKGHGGARDGAGRKPGLNADQQLWVGAYYQNCWVKFIRCLARKRQRSDATKTAIRTEDDAGKDALSQLHSAHRGLRKLSVQERRRRGWVNPLREQAESWIEALGGRYVSYAHYVKRPKSLRPALMRHVALKASRRFAVNVSPQMVERSIKQFRALEKEIRADLEFDPE